MCYVRRTSGSDNEYGKKEREEIQEIHKRRFYYITDNGILFMYLLIAYAVISTQKSNQLSIKIKIS